MGAYLFLATTAGVHILAQTKGQWAVARRTLKERALTCVAFSGDVIVAGSTEGAWRSGDNGQNWQRAEKNLTLRHLRWLSAVPNAAMTFLAGTEPAGIFLSTDGATSWRWCPEVGELRDAHGWFLPYSPKAGCIRGFAIAASGPHPGRIYAAAEVGGVLVSEDNAATWQMADGSDGNPDMNLESETLIHPDVHSISVHPTSSDWVTAATGGGLYRSMDGGKSWRNLYRCYIRAVWVDPEDFRHMIAGPADGVALNGRIEESHDGGKHWNAASEGMQVPWRRHMVERFTCVDNNLYAVLSNGELWFKRLGETRWLHLLPDLPAVRAIAAAK